MGRKKVPWKNLEEWRFVKEKLNSDLKAAYEVLLVWKARSSNLPANVECTLSVVQAMLEMTKIENEDYFASTLLAKESTVQLCLSAALVRFINHVSAGSCVQGDSLYLAAQKQNIPDWIVNLRHDVAHSATLPPLPLLCSAIMLARDWLMKNYWNVQEDGMMCVENTTPNDLPLSSRSKVGALLHLAMGAWHACSSDLSDIRKVTDMSTESWDSLLTLCQSLESNTNLHGVGDFELFTSTVRLVEMHRAAGEPMQMRMSQLIDIIEGLIHRLCRKKSAREAFLNVFIGCDFLKDSRISVRQLMPFIRILHSINSLGPLLNHVVSRLSLGSGEEIAVARTWLEQLARPLSELRQRWLQQGDEPPMDKDTLEFSSHPPPEIDLSVFKPILISVEPLLQWSAIRHYLDFLTPTPNNIDTIRMLMEKMELNEINTEQSNLDEDVIYGVSDLPIAAITTNDGPCQLSRLGMDVWQRTPIGMVPGLCSQDLQLTHLTWEVKASADKFILDY